MKRRDLLAVIGGSVAAIPSATRAQPRSMPVVGYLSSGSREAFAPYVEAFLGGLRDAGFEQGRNVAVEFRWLEGRFERAPALLAELIDRRSNVLVVAEASMNALRAAATTIPIVGLFASDPVKSGHVASYNRPGGNITGVQMFAAELGAKRLQLLREIVPNAAVIAVLGSTAIPTPAFKDDLATVAEFARSVGQRIEILGANNESEIDAAFAVMAEKRMGGLLVMSSPLFNNRRQQIIALAARHAIPALYEWRQFTEIGGLASYGASFTDTQRQMGRHAGAILKGAKPAELPIVQTVKIELVLNQKTADALNLTFPQTLLGRAEEVLE